MVKVIFINAQEKQVTEVMLPKEKVLRETYKLIGNDCSLVQTGAYFTGNDALMVDEEGYFKEGLEGVFINGKGFFYGNAVIWGCDEEGEAADCETLMQDVLPDIVWIDKMRSDVIRQRVMGGERMYFL